MRTFQYIHHPHIGHRNAVGPPKTEDAAIGWSDRLGLKITAVVGSMACAGVFTLLTLLSLPSALQSGSIIIIVAWIAQTFLQLVLLSVILVGQNVQGAAADKRAESTFMDAEAIIHEATQIETHLLSQDARFEAQEKTLASIITQLQPIYIDRADAVQSPPKTELKSTKTQKEKAE